MKNIFIIKSSYDIDSKELVPGSGSLSQNLCSSSDSDNEKEEKIDTNDPDISDSDMLKSLSSLLCNFWDKRQLHFNTDFALA